MEIKSRFDHFNINVLDLDRSIAFYGKALGLKEHHRKEATDGSFTLVYLTDNETGFLLELTWLRDRKEAYELGDNESHLANITENSDTSVSKITRWACISSMIQTIIGLKFYLLNNISGNIFTSISVFFE